MRFLFFISFFFISLLGVGQQITQYSQWTYNQFAINPALAGVKRCIDIRSAARLQWSGFDGAPTSGLLTINAPLSRKDKRYDDFFHGIGGKIERDIFGPFNNLSIGLAYALHFPLGKTGTEHRLSFGLSAGLQQFGFDRNKIITIDADPAVAQSSSVLLFPLIGFGGWYYSKRFYVGVAIDQLAKNKWDDIGYASRFRLHTKLQGGTKFTFENNNSILPGLLLRVPPAGPASIDINVMFDFKNQLMVGLGYRNTDAIIGYFKVNVKQFTVGYSFDFITSAIRGGNFHTHELSIQYIGCSREERSQDACPLFD